jgi:mRNA interferase MazF
MPRRGEVYWADLDPVVGSELGRKPRPVVVVSVDAFNDSVGKLIVVPSTSTHRDSPTQVPWPVSTRQGVRQSYFSCEDVRAISSQRLRGRIGSGFLPSSIIAKIEQVLRYQLGL